MGVPFKTEILDVNASIVFFVFEPGNYDLNNLLALPDTVAKSALEMFELVDRKEQNGKLESGLSYTAYLYELQDENGQEFEAINVFILNNDLMNVFFGFASSQSFGYMDKVTEGMLESSSFK